MSLRTNFQVLGLETHLSGNLSKKALLQSKWENYNLEIKFKTMIH
jgi:hypothetical protein